jgi:hypothetical protein
VLWLLALAVGLAPGLLFGGRLDNFARLHFRWPAVVIGAVAVRAAVLATPLNAVEGAQWLYAASLAIIVAWTGWHIARLPGIWLVAAGAALNLVVVVANGARMPVAMALAGSLVQSGHVGQYTLMGPDTNLGQLADWISLGPIPGAYSPGDLVISAGLALTTFLVARRVPAARTGGQGRPYSE